MFRYIFHKYSQPEVNQTLTSLTLSANIETVIWKWRRDCPWLKVSLIILCLPFIWAGRITPDNLSDLNIGLPPSVDPLSYWSHYYFPKQIVSFAQSLTRITALELSFPPNPMPLYETWRYKLPWPHPQPSYFCEVLKCLAPNLLQLTLQNWPRAEGDFTEAIQFPRLTRFIWCPHESYPWSCLGTLKESLRGSEKLEEIDLRYYLQSYDSSTEAGVLPVNIKEFLYPHLRKFNIYWYVFSTPVPQDARKFVSLYRDTIQVADLGIFQRAYHPYRSIADEDILSLLKPSNLLSLSASRIQEYRYEQFRSALMPFTALQSLSLILQDLPSGENPFVFLPNLASLRLRIEVGFWWDEPLWALMRCFPMSLPALRKLKMWSGFSLFQALPGNMVASLGKRISPKGLEDDLSYTMQPYIQFADSLRAVLEESGWKAWGLEDIDIGFGHMRVAEDQRFVYTLMARCLPQVLIFGGAHRSTWW
ncbi:hypothetical protein DL96DRAFT_1806387 [Flagelloscypha sp. PMI_526]|nr:hypothetical protein DL96DRAFT_1806387 [Flagelloscypha sp. PMI_526]